MSVVCVRNDVTDDVLVLERLSSFFVTSVLNVLCCVLTTVASKLIGVGLSDCIGVLRLLEEGVFFAFFAVNSLTQC